MNEGKKIKWLVTVELTDEQYLNLPANANILYKYENVRDLRGMKVLEQYGDLEQKLFDVALEFFGVTKEIIRRVKRGKREVSDIRTIIGIILKDNTNYTLAKVGNIINRDHSSILHYKNTHDSLMLDKQYSRKYKILNTLIK